MSGYTPVSPPQRRASNSRPNPDRCQQPEDADGEEILTSRCPPGLKDDSVRTFIFKNQTYTLGNALKEHLLQYPEIKFCGCSISHPGENEMHLRIQTNGGVSATDMLRRALEDVAEMCDDVEAKTVAAVKAYEKASKKTKE